MKRRRIFSVNSEAANNKTLYYISHCLFLQLFFLHLTMYERRYIKNEPRRNKKTKNNEANNKTASYIINLGAAPSSHACSCSAIDCSLLARCDIQSRAILNARRETGSDLKLKRSIILLNSIIIVVCWNASVQVWILNAVWCYCCCYIIHTEAQQ